jgi:hypothetical protein
MNGYKTRIIEKHKIPGGWSQPGDEKVI